LYVVPFFLLNRRVVRTAGDLEDHSRQMGSGVRRLVSMVLNRRGARGDLRNWRDVYHAMLPADQNVSALRDIMLARNRVGLRPLSLLGWCRTCPSPAQQ